MHRLAARTGLASAAQYTREAEAADEDKTDDEASDGASQDHDEDDADEETRDSHEVLGGAGRQLRWLADDDDHDVDDAVASFAGPKMPTRPILQLQASSQNPV